MEGLSNVTPEETKRSNLNSFKEPRITIRSAVHGNKVMSEMKIIDDKTDYAIPTTIKSSKKSSKNTSLKRVESLKSPVSILKSSTSLKRVKTQKSPNQLSSQRNDTSLKKLESNTSKNSRKFLSVKKDSKSIEQSISKKNSEYILDHSPNFGGKTELITPDDLINVVEDELNLDIEDLIKL